MHFCTPDDGQQFPQASPSGETGELLDTGWEIHWPGPGHVYIGERDAVDILVAFLHEGKPLVAEALEVNGWTSPGATAAKVAGLEEKLAAAATVQDVAVKADELKAALDVLAAAPINPPAKSAKSAK